MHKHFHAATIIVFAFKHTLTLAIVHYKLSNMEGLDLPGFRFHPTEEELLDFYLKNMVFGKKLCLDIIGYLNIYHHDPWDLPGIQIFFILLDVSQQFCVGVINVDIMYIDELRNG